MVKIKAFFQLIRWTNLTMVIAIGLSMRYLVIQPILVRSYPDVSTGLTWSTINFILLLVATLLITASGYIINDVCDVATDKINKPHKIYIDKYFSRKRATLIHHVFNIIALAIGAYLSWDLGNISYAVLFLLPIVLLRLYAMRLSRMFLIGNLTIAFLSGLVIITLSVFDILHYHMKWYEVIATIKNVTFSESPTQLMIYWMLGFAGFSFLTTLSREIAKDYQDMEGDRFIGAKTLPIVIGEKKTKWVLVALQIITIAIIFYVVNSLLKPENGFYYGFEYGSLVIALFLGVLYLIFTGNGLSKYRIISMLFKLIMLVGLGYSLLNYFFYHSIFI